MSEKKLGFKKGIICLVAMIIIMAAFGILPFGSKGMVVNATETPPESAAKIDETYYDTVQEALDAAEPGDTVTLLSDYVSGADDYRLEINNKTLTLDLNGHNIDYSENTSASYILDCVDTKLTLTDTSDGKAGKLIGSGTRSMEGVHFAGTEYDFDNPKNAFVMKGGTITDCKSHGVYAYNCPITMTSGTITNCGEYYCDSAIYLGYCNDCTISGGKITQNNSRGVYINTGSFLTLSGTAEISNNTKDDDGAGVYISGGTFIMDGGTISGNNAKGYGGDGGGVYINPTLAEDKVAFMMNGGTIKDNTAGYQGGGVYVSSSCKFRMTGGTITGNSSVYNFAYAVGGVFFYSSRDNGGEFLVSGDASVTGNQYTGGDTPCMSNVFFQPEGSTIIVEDALTGEIGVTPVVYDSSTYSYTPSSDPFAVASEEYSDGLTTSDAECFISDNTDYAVGLEDGKAKLIERVAVTSVKLNKMELPLKVGESETLTATISPNEATDKHVTWSSSAEGVVTVDKNGKVTAVSSGTATITVTTRDGGFTATCEVTVKTDPVITKNPVAITGLVYNGQAQALVTAGEVKGGTFYYALGNANGATGTYTTSIPTATNAGTYYVWYKVVGDAEHNDTDSAFVVVTIKNADTTKAKDNKTTFSIKNKAKVKKTAKIKIKDKDKIKKITLNGKKIKIKSGKTSFILKLKSYKKKLKKKGKWNTLVVVDAKGNKKTLKFKTK